MKSGKVVSIPYYSRIQNTISKKFSMATFETYLQTSDQIGFNLKWSLSLNINLADLQLVVRTRSYLAGKYEVMNLRSSNIVGSLEPNTKYFLYIETSKGIVSPTFNLYSTRGWVFF